MSCRNATKRSHEDFGSHTRRGKRSGGGTEVNPEERAFAECAMAYLIRMAMADGTFSREEKDVIGEYQKRFGMHPSDMERIAACVIAYDMPPLPESMDVRERILGELIDFCACDGVADEEIAQLEDVCDEFGISHERLRQILSEHGACA